MKVVLWILRIVVFVGLFGLAIKNSGTVELRFFFDRVLDAPLSLTILAVFALGVLIGISATMTTLVRQRRHIARLNRQNNQNQDN